MKKPTKRKAFNFLRSYFDVLNELPDDQTKLDFLLAIINKQFLDENPEGLSPMAKLAFESQRHSIESSVKGYKHKKKTDLLGNPIKDPSQGGTQGGTQAPSVQEEEKEEEKEQNVLEFCLQKSQVLRNLCERGGWDAMGVKEYCLEFLDINYPKGGDLNDIRRHFLNKIKQVEPRKRNPKRIINSFDDMTPEDLDR